MEIRLDPDKDSIENLRLVAKILGAKVMDRGGSRKKKGATKVLESVIRVLEKRVGRTIPVCDIMEEMEGFDEEEVEKAIDSLKRKGQIYEPRKGFVQRI